MDDSDDDDYEGVEISAEPTTLPTAPLPRLTRSTYKIHQRLRDEAMRKELGDASLIFESLYALQSDPRTLKEAYTTVQAPKWKAAAQKEYDSLVANNTFILVPRPKGRKVIKCKWVLTTKLNQDGSIERLKARLVAKGYSQIPGVDFTQTYSPTLHKTSMRMMLALAAIYDLEVDQIDVETAFLNGDIEEDIYMEQPPGFVVEGKEGMVCKLTKALYGLKQAGLAWRKKLEQALRSVGFEPLLSDPCIYVRTNDPTNMIGTHVDDGCVIGSSQKIIEKTKR